MPIPSIKNINLETVKRIILAIVLSLLIVSLLYTSFQLNRTKEDLFQSEQNVSVLESTLEAERQKAIQREADAKLKQDQINKLNSERKRLDLEYQTLESQLSDLIPQLETSPEDVKETAEQAITISIKCLEAATGGEQCQ